MRSKYSSYLSLILFFAGVFMLFPAKSKALNYADFKPGRIIDDVVFTNKTSMSLDQIQSFLNSKVPVCDTNHTGFTQTLKRYTDAQGREVVNTARFDPPFTCVKDYREHPTQTYTVNYTYINTSGVTINASVVKKVNNSHRLQSVTFEYFGGNPANGISKSISTYVGVGGGNITGAKTAAQIIYDAAQTYNINPQALIVTLEKETSLITDDWAAGWQYDRAMGWACPDTGIGQSANCDTSKEGFMNQVMGAGWQYRNDFNGIDTVGFWSPYGKGLNNILYNPNVSCGYRTVNIENQATAVLYKYTPYTPNDAAIYASPGVTVTCGAYGNRNFWRLFNYWFGDPLTPPWSAQFISLEDYTDDKKTTRISHNNLYPNQRIFLSLKFKNTGTTTWTVGGPGTMRISTEGGASPFCDTTWIACWRPANMKESSVKPGEIATFEFWYKAPNATYAAYATQFSLVAEMQSQVLGDRPVAYTLVSRPKAQFISLEDYTDDKKTTRISHNNLYPNQRIFLSLKFKNTGTTTWTVGGPGTMRISTEGGASPFCDTTWIACWRPANMKESSVKPGEIATFEFWYKAPNATYAAYATQFSLVAEMQSQVLGDRPIIYTLVKSL